MGESPAFSWGELAGILTAAGVLLAALGGLVGHAVSSRKQKREHDANVDQLVQSATANLIEQLQEQIAANAAELARHREAAEKRANLADERANMLEARVQSLTELVTGYRDYAHALRSHIFEGLGPPPPEWPDGLAR